MELKISTFIDKILKVADMETAPENERMEMAEEIMKQLAYRITKRIAFEDISQYNLEKRPIDALVNEILQDKPELSEEIFYEIDDLYEELVSAQQACGKYIDK